MIFGIIVACILQTFIPTLAWHGVQEGKYKEYFPSFREAGIDWYLASAKTLESAEDMLASAQKNGLKVFVRCPELFTDTENVSRIFDSYSSFGGYYIKDEPETWDLDELGKIVERIRAIDLKHPCYVNLYPNWAWGNEKYEEHLHLFAQKVNTPFYSFDQYPLTEVDGDIVVRPLWYRNLEEMRNLSIKNGKPFWAFALLESHHLGAPSPEAFYPVPTLGHLRLQVYSDLVYGAQVIQYFTYRGAVDKQGKKTPVFKILKQMNAEIRGYSGVFLGSTVKSVRHFGTVPDGTNNLSLPYACINGVSHDGAGIILSDIENGGCHYLAIVNKDCVNEQKITLKFASEAKIIGANGKLSKVSGEKFTLEPGNILILQY